VTACTGTTEIPGTPSTSTTPGRWTSTAGPIYDFQSMTNIPRGRTVQLELAPTAEGFFGANYALTSPLAVQ
jgi:hypothetical protein